MQKKNMQQGRHMRLSSHTDILISAFVVVILKTLFPHIEVKKIRSIPSPNAAKSIISRHKLNFSLQMLPQRFLKDYQLDRNEALKCELQEKCGIDPDSLHPK